MPRKAIEECLRPSATVGQTLINCRSVPPEHSSENVGSIEILSDFYIKRRRNWAAKIPHPAIQPNVNAKQKRPALAMIDVVFEKETVRWQALQTRQLLGLLPLSICDQDSSNLRSLFA